MDEAIDHRLVALESRLAHHERLAEEVSDVLAVQAKAIDVLTAEVRRLRLRLGEMEGGWAPSPADDRPPPHY
ncbi:MAG TPA: SlyX family protein [Rhodospirillaceae bacterium]|nr:SlyX family protein [Rhodospirillaceae bacterium]